jgi:amino acid transporter
MILATRSAYLRLLAAAATIGAIAAGAVSFTIPRRYVSTAMMRLTPPAVAGEPAWQIEAEAAHRLPEMRGEVLSRQSLTEIIERPAIDLYRQERATQPLEDVMVDMRRDIHIELVPAPARAQGRIPLTLRVTFEYPDPVKAQAVVRHLSARLSQLKSGTAGSGLAEVLTPASLPEKPSQPDRLAIVAIGLGAGLAIGILFAFLYRRGLKWTLRVAGCAVAGSILAVAVTLVMPDAFADDQKSYQFVGLGALAGVACGAFLLRARPRGPASMRG